MKAFIFPGQGSQFEGMGKELYNHSEESKSLFELANKVLGYDIIKIMTEGSAEELKQTTVTQSAVFLHSVIQARVSNNFNPDVVAGHSLGEFSAIVSVGGIKFEDGLRLVHQRASAMQEACNEQDSTMAAILGLDNGIIENICRGIEEVVVPANYNCPGQLVISGTTKGIERAVEELNKAGARRAIILPVNGAFHSPLMESARNILKDAISSTAFFKPECPVYQNVTGLPYTNPEDIKANLVDQLTAPVKWNQTMQNMLKDGVSEFVEVGGNGKTLSSFVKKVDRKIPTSPLEL